MKMNLLAVANRAVSRRGLLGDIFTKQQSSPATIRSLYKPCALNRLHSKATTTPFPPRQSPSLSTIPSHQHKAHYTNMSDSSFYTLKARRPNGTDFDFADLKGQVVLIVNVASKWCAIHFFFFFFAACRVKPPPTILKTHCCYATSQWIHTAIRR